MCGIVGIASQLPVTGRDLLIIQHDTMHHRGPDDAGEWWSTDGRVGLAQRWLAIIDLSPGGHQAMLDSSGQLCITLRLKNESGLICRCVGKETGSRYRKSASSKLSVRYGGVMVYRAWR